MEYWHYIYNHFDPIAFNIFGFKVHWYGIMYVLALVSALFLATWFVKKDNYPISKHTLESYFWWAEIGVILGARIGYFIFYDPNPSYYLLHPWQMFNPYHNGEFVGIRGMSYHGAIIGFLVSTFLFSKKYRVDVWMLLDIVALSVPLAYVFGRIGNFLNQELIGRATDVSWGIYVFGVLRHPSQLYEAFLEGIVVFLILFWYRRRKRFNGELITLYGILYGTARFTAEFFREPDPQLGFVCCGWMTMGQILSLLMILISLIIYFYLYKKWQKA